MIKNSISEAQVPVWKRSVRLLIVALLVPLSVVVCARLFGKWDANDRQSLGNYFFARSLTTQKSTSRSASTLANGGENNSPLVSNSKDHVIHADLGYLQPLSECIHRFTIRNDSTIPWTFRGVHVTCSCTSTRKSGAVIDPMSSGWVEVLYRAPQIEVDDKRHVEVVFQEQLVLPVRLTIDAKIREPIYAVPNRLDFRSTNYSRSFVPITLVRFSDVRWEKVTIVPKDSWLQATITKQDPTLDHFGEMRDAWRIDTIPHLSNLDYGRHESSLQITIETSAGELNRIIPVIVDHPSPLLASPSLLFFGKFKRKQTLERDLQLSCPSCDPLDCAAIKIEHNIPDLEVTAMPVAAKTDTVRLHASFIGGHLPKDASIKVRYANAPQIPPIVVRVVGVLVD